MQKAGSELAGCSAFFAHTADQGCARQQAPRQDTSLSPIVFLSLSFCLVKKVSAIKIKKVAFWSMLIAPLL